MSIISAATLRQFITFAGVGVIGTAGHYLVLVLLVELAAVDPVAATTAGFVTGAIINYVLNYRYTFASSLPHAATLARFFAVALVGGIVNSLIMYAGASLLEFNYLLVQIVATCLVLLQNFILNKVWTFAQ